MYGFNAPGEPIEVVTLRLSATGEITKPSLRRVEKHSDPDAARKSEREIYFAEKGDFVRTPVLDRYKLGADCRFEGPAVVQEMDSTTLVHPGYTAHVDSFGNLLIES